MTKFKKALDHLRSMAKNLDDANNEVVMNDTKKITMSEVSKAEIEEFKKAIDRVQALLEKVESLGDAGKAIVANHVFEKAEKLQLSEFDFTVKQLKKAMKNWNPHRTNEAEKADKKMKKDASAPPPPPPADVSTSGLAGAAGTSSAGISTGAGLMSENVSARARSIGSAFN